MNSLLELRKKLKAKKPTFIRHDAHKKSRVSKTWRRPKGRQNKMRLGMKGYARARSTGYGSPLGVKGLSAQGLIKSVILTKKDIDMLDVKKNGIIFSRTLGAKKKLDLIAYAQEKGFTILEFDVDRFKKSVEERLAKKAQEKKRLEKRKQARDKKKSSKKDSTKETTKEDKKELSDEEKKVQEKKEHDKLLVEKGEAQ
ncbi:MAG: eL32 family ribosomal protein [Candidatus Nanoarchaeia archaeon]